MVYANNVKEIPNALTLGPLTGEDLSTYFIETMAVRTGDPYTSPMLDILDACHNPSERNAHLLLGHRGCGKSTELNKLSAELDAEGFPVHSIQCAQELDPLNITHTDLLILMGDALLQIAKGANISLDEDLCDRIHRFWRESVECEREEEEKSSDEAEAGIGIGLDKFINFFCSLKTSLKYNETERKTYREKVERRSSEWIMLLQRVIDSIAEAYSHNRPVLIFEDLDKLEPASAWRVFSNYSDTLSCLSCPIIYTFPIALSYDPQFSALKGFFEVVTLPMIKIMNPDGSQCDDGYANITAIVRARMDEKLFAENSLSYMIEKTGGALRDLFTVINTAARRADRRKSAVVEMDDAKQALSKIKSDLTRQIDSDYYEFLADICKGQRERIENKEKLLQMLRAGTVLEYNGRRWHNVHPLVADFLKEQGFLDD